MKDSYLVQPCRRELWAAFDHLMNTAKQQSSSSFVARDLLVYSHCRDSFDIGGTFKFDGPNRVAAIAVLLHTINGGDDQEFGNYLKHNDLTELAWLKDRVWVTW